MITKPKGTYDLLGSDSVIYDYALDTFKGMCELNNYNYMKTPTFEASELFHRGVGETTDIIKKETYDFLDKKGRSMTLRPEGTAGVVRSLIENKLYANVSGYLKYYYYGPMFRYERPQSGRFREFNQFGIEVFGPMNPYIDAEVINLGVKYFQVLGIDNIKIKINNLSSKQDREKYKVALVEYMSKHKNELCEDCLERLEKNPLRILDCKVDGDKDFFKSAPKISEFISPESKEYFDTLLSTLDSIEIEYEIDENLVRGLDYYDYAVFEFVTEDKNLTGASTICAGGRYNDLVKTLGGPELNGIGFALGYERLQEILKSLDLTKQSKDLDVYVIPVTNNEVSDALIIGTMLKDAGYKTEIDYRDVSLKNKYSQANKMNTAYIVTIGEEELKNYTVKLKDAKTSEEKTIGINNLVEELDMSF